MRPVTLCVLHPSDLRHHPPSHQHAEGAQQGRWRDPRRYPNLRDQIGSGVDQLHVLRRTFGTEAQKLVDETHMEDEHILSKARSTTTIYQATQLVQDKPQQVRDIGCLAL